MAIECTGTLTEITVQGQYNVVACQGGSWVSAPEPLYQLYELLEAIFSTPDPLDISAAFMVGIGLPLICYLVSWGYGVVVNWFGYGEINDGN